MSLCVITKKTQNCEAVVKWLHQSYWIGDNGQAFCILEFIINVNAGSLNQLSLYFPYFIEELDDGNKDLVNENNKYFYSDGYEILRVESGIENYGTIVLDGITTDVGKITIESKKSKIGSYIDLTFLKPLAVNDNRAVRIRYKCKGIALEKIDGSYGLYLEYYSNKAPALLDLKSEETINIENLFIWLTFPVNTKYISNSSPMFKQQALTRSIMKEYGVIYGPGFDKKIEEGPTRPVAFWKLSKTNHKAAIYPWNTIYFYCDFALGEILHDDLTKGKQIKNLKLERRNIYARILTNMPDYKEVEKIDKKTFDAFVSKKDTCDIFIIDRGEYKSRTVGKVYFLGVPGFKTSKRKKQASDGEKPSIESDEILVTPLLYQILIHTLKREGNAGFGIDVVENCWHKDKDAEFIKELKMEWNLLMNKDISRGDYLDTKPSKRVRRSVGRLSTVLQHYLNITLQTRGELKYTLSPIPEYCILMCNTKSDS